MTDTLAPCWRDALAPAFAAPSMAALNAFLAGEAAAGKRIYPPAPDRFCALERTPLDAVRVVILGQDPYHGPGQAHGLSFSVPPGVRPPPSLANIFRELRSDVGAAPPGHGCLLSWAQQGVLLLNTVLTVEAGHAGSHQKRGWEPFTDAVINAVVARAAPTVFMLWGRPAQQKAALAAHAPQHLILPAVHPSPLSAHRGWFGARPFSRANIFLAAAGRPPIDWQLPPMPPA
ncbi:MAG: hypothetical protein RLZZ58_1678 [Pseudomonadota bacterium]